MKTEKTRLLKSKGERTTITLTNFIYFILEILKIKRGNNSKLKGLRDDLTATDRFVFKMLLD